MGWGAREGVSGLSAAARTGTDRADKTAETGLAGFQTFEAPRQRTISSKRAFVSTARKSSGRAAKPTVVGVKRELLPEPLPGSPRAAITNLRASAVVARR